MSLNEEPRRIVIMGAAGRDFHNFNTVYRQDPAYRVVAFTASQIPDIADRRYPTELAGPLYPGGIPIVEESELDTLIRQQGVDRVVFAYSDISHREVMHRASIVLAAGADFILLGPQQTMLQAEVPVIAVSAVRTGCGKSQTCRWIAQRLREAGVRCAAIRHPMPYGELENQAVQRFARRQDLLDANCTIEEREEYEPYLAGDNIVYAGVDYAAIVARAQSECQLILWDGGNNDFPFIHPDLHIVLVDPLRPGHETSHHPGEATLRMADIVVIAKVNSAADADVQRVSANVRRINPEARILHGASPVVLSDISAVRGKRALVVEDGPTITHGGMAYGAGYVATARAEPQAIVDPRRSATPAIQAVYQQYPHIGQVLPAVGYHPAQLQALEDTINAAEADVVVAGTPIDLASLITLNKPVVRARYDYADLSRPGLAEVIQQFLRQQGLRDNPGS